MLAKAEERKATLIQKSEKSEDVAELRSIQSELPEVNQEIKDLEELISEEEARAAADPAATSDSEERKALAEEARAIGTFTGNSQTLAASQEQVRMIDTQAEQLRNNRPIEVPFEARATTIASGDLVVETKYKRTLAPQFNDVSSLIDRVKASPMQGGNAYTAGFEISHGEAGETTETGDYADVDPTFGYVDVGKVKITAYSEITDEAVNLPNVDYRQKVIDAVNKSIRKRITKQILIGAGTANTFTGIFNAPTNVIPTASDLDIADIDANTLDSIVLNYGGDEDVEGAATLIINKATLTNFAKVRSTDGKKLYKITMDSQGNSGTISSEGSWNVPFVLNSAVGGFDAVVEDAYFGAYGKLETYEMPIFSQLTIQESKDFKFKSGQIAYRGSIWAGGNVTSYKGFMRLKKNAVA